MIERLTEKRIIQPSCKINGELENREYIHIKDKSLAEKKLFELEDIEQELGIDLVSLFDSKYTSTICEMELEEDDKMIYFDGDSFYGHYSAEEFLNLIKDMLSMYKQLIKLKRN